MSETGHSRVSLYRHTSFTTLERVENVEHYRPGGYHPIDIGATITNGEDRYTVAHKLGHGGFSTVWLVKRQRKHLPVSFHALKVLRADVDDSRAGHELYFLQRLGQVGRSSHPNIVMVEDSFTLSGPNGEHRCVVFPVLGLTHYSNKVETLTPSQRHSISQQLASAVSFLHSHDVCHGDLTPSNIAFVVPGIQSMTETRLLEVLGPVKEELLRLRKGPVPHSKHGPKKVVAAASFSGLDPSSLTTVQIIDFGCAFLSNNPPPVLGCPVQFYPPELLYGYPASAKCDIWQLAAIVFFTYTNSYMFQVGFQIFIHLIPFIVQHHGPVPSHWRGKFVWSKYGFASPGEPVLPLPEPDWWFDDKEPTKSFGARIAKRASYLSASQQEELGRLLCEMVTWEPSSRISAAEAERRLKALALPSFGEQPPSK